MKNWKITAIGAILLFACVPGNPADSKAKPAESAVFDAGEFSLTPPRGWKMVSSPRTRTEIQVRWDAPPPNKDPGCSIIVYMVTGLGPVDEEQILKSKSSMGTGGTLTGPTRLLIGDERGRLVAYQRRGVNLTNGSGRPLSYAETQFVADRSISLTFYCEPAGFARLERQYQAAVRSFRLSPSAAPSAPAPEPNRPVPMLR
jgi:hypothetical protein